MKNLLHIWVIYYPLNQPGGVNTWIENFIAGMRHLGHTVDMSYATPKGNMKVDKNKHTRMGSKVRSEDRLPGDVIAYWTYDDIDAYVERAGNYDIVVFAHPSPHDTKAYDDPEMRWLQLYSESPVPVVSIFHDDGWKKTNPWVINISDHCECLLFAQHRFLEYAIGDDGGEPFPYIDACLLTWESFPIAWECDVGLYDNDKVVVPMRTGVCLSQWQGWKNHKHLLPQLCGYKSYALDLYGAGIQYYYQRKEEYWKCAIGYDFVTDELNAGSPHTYRGYVPYADVPGVLQEASFAIDASTRGRENMSMIEPLAYGAVSIVTSDVLRSTPHQKLQEKFVVAVELHELGAAMRDVTTNFEWYTAERLAGLEFVRMYHTIEGVCNRLSQLFEAVIDCECGVWDKGLRECLM